MPDLFTNNDIFSSGLISEAEGLEIRSAARGLGLTLMTMDDAVSKKDSRIYLESVSRLSGDLQRLDRILRIVVKRMKMLENPAGKA